MSRVRWLVALVILALVSLPLYQQWRSDGNQVGWVSTQWGPIGPADRDLLAKVRQAGLWEMPVSQEAMTRATQPRVREIAVLIANEHHELDIKTRETATQLGVELPNQPSFDQQHRMREITNQVGTAYDAMMVQRLREAHGAVLPLILQVRTGTRNSLMRAFAQDAATYVDRHVNYLESTGLVDFSSLPEPSTYSAPTFNQQISRTALIVFASCAAGVVLLVFLLTRRHRPPKTRARHILRKDHDAQGARAIDRGR